MATKKTVKISLAVFDSMRHEMKTLRKENTKLRAKVAAVEKAPQARPSALTILDDDLDVIIPFQSRFGCSSYYGSRLP